MILPVSGCVGSTSKRLLFIIYSVFYCRFSKIHAEITVVHSVWNKNRAALELTGGRHGHVFGGIPGTTIPLTGATALSGTVTSAQGTGLPVNTPCSISISPTPPQAVQNGYNCHVRVQCGASIIYGWEGSGYTKCQVTGGTAVRADDTTGAAAGDDPMLALDLVNRTCQVSDDGATPYTVVITLTPPTAEAPVI